MKDEGPQRPHVLAIVAFAVGVAAVVGFCVETLPSVAAAYVAVAIGFAVGKWF